MKYHSINDDFPKYADMAESADALDSGSSGSNTVCVQVTLSAPITKGYKKSTYSLLLYLYIPPQMAEWGLIMKNPMEKLSKEISRFIEENPDLDYNSDDGLLNVANLFQSQQPSDDELEKPDADYYLELAESAETQKTALKYAKKAVELEPDNVDALSAVIELSCNTPEKLDEKYAELIDETEKNLKKQGFFDSENIGDFWLIFETRPYMRLLEKYAANFVECGQMRLAIPVFEKMLELCTNDNLGVRYSLMHIYAYLEDEESALKLYKKYPEDGTQILLPLSILYYKLGDYRKANQYLKKLSNVNKDTAMFFSNISEDRLMKTIENMSPHGYHPCTIEEFLIELEENSFLFETSATFFLWARKKISSKKS